jgi:hypothetical protein
MFPAVDKCLPQVLSALICKREDYWDITMDVKHFNTIVALGTLKSFKEYLFVHTFNPTSRRLRQEGPGQPGLQLALNRV